MDINFLLDGIREGIAAMTWLEAVAAFLGIASVFYSMKEHIWVYPTGIVSTLIYVWICFQFKLYADMGINAYYFSMSIYGWYAWTHPKENESILPTTWLSSKGWITSVLLFAGSYAILSTVLSNFTDSDVPYWDSLTTSSAFVGMWLMAKKKVENWYFWLLTDFVSIPLYFYKGLMLTSFQYLVFTVLAILGLLAWIKSAKAHEAHL
ncbi:nicotinamide riboside transporter PnuC [Algoriphagus zhangzhouensis]|uniref:Nicotinamide riboside transporter PnuC n=1 Tax=Algoriphagus zhangzhouensis TaxID=1073327 RepID=A0A1M7Z9X0_9BACT|nr:nicotinamide riboside transporter PnuC [Algoriphagus zhangzhouensis]TDY47297.1 nicotinamide mononucleotide transporter [Algoriphagus zhangzhouensis]SHO61695.1 nicotinamide mononucleotide transporter [Algoriphagus zhangzhouensis]